MALKKYHSWLMQKIFQNTLPAEPYKSDLKALSKGQKAMKECLAKMGLFLVNFMATFGFLILP